MGCPLDVRARIFLTELEKSSKLAAPEDNRDIDSIAGLLQSRGLDASDLIDIVEILAKSKKREAEAMNDVHQQLRIADDPSTSPEQLSLLLSSDSVLLKCSAIENKSLPYKEIEKLTGSRNIHIRQSLSRRGLKLDSLIIKIKEINGKNIRLRNVLASDAKFILSLRTDLRKNQYISTVSGELEDQIKWLKSYEKDENQAYFIIEDKDKAESVGTVRVYDKRGNSFCWGSWILKDNIQPNIAIESALLVYQYGLYMGFTESHFEVRKGNSSVWKFHERFGAKRIGETEQDYLYKIENDNIMSAFSRYKKYLTEEIDIVPLCQD